jgi:hypothetical protein
MTYEAMLDELNKAGCRASLHGEQLRISGAGKMSREVKDAVREHAARLARDVAGITPQHPVRVVTAHFAPGVEVEYISDGISTVPNFWRRTA